MSNRTWTKWLLAGLTAAVLTGAGCRTNAQHLKAADRIARRNIAHAQFQALGHAQPLEIVSPEQTLRRRLMEAQHLPYSEQASMGPQQAVKIKQWPRQGPRRDPHDLSGPDIPVVVDQPVVLSLVEALQVGARNSRDYQTRKEDVFRTALDLELQQHLFETTFAGAVNDVFSWDTTSEPGVSGNVLSPEASVTRRLKSGATIVAGLSMDLAQLLNPQHASSLGTLADATVSVPLLRGAGRFVVTEPLTQAQRDLVYSLWEFERFRKTFAVDIASQYLGVLQQMDQVDNAQENYRQLIASGRRARRWADAGRLPQIQVEQARQDELRARERWILATEQAKRRLDEFKIALGLPTDAWIELDRKELGEQLAGAWADRITAMAGATTQPTSQPDTQPGEAPDAQPASQPASGLAAQPGEGPAGPPAPSVAPTSEDADAPIVLVPADREHRGPFELEEEQAVRLAFDHRLDLRAVQGRVVDAQRHVAVAANALLPDLTLTGSATYGQGRNLGSAASPDARLTFDEGNLSAGANLDLPWDRTREAAAYRDSFIAFERAVRDLQELEDQIKLQLRNALRSLLGARESLAIQAQAVQLAWRRVQSTDLFLQAGRAEIRDVLDAQESLISAKNAYTAAQVEYRVAELEIQRDMGTLDINEEGLWREHQPEIAVHP